MSLSSESSKCTPSLWACGFEREPWSPRLWARALEPKPLIASLGARNFDREPRSPKLLQLSQNQLKSFFAAKIKKEEEEGSNWSNNFFWNCETLSEIICRSEFRSELTSTKFRFMGRINSAPNNFFPSIGPRSMWASKAVSTPGQLGQNFVAWATLGENVPIGPLFSLRN